MTTASALLNKSKTSTEKNNHKKRIHHILCYRRRYDVFFYSKEKYVFTSIFILKFSLFNNYFNYIFSLNKYSLYKISVDLIFFKTHQLNSYLLCTFMYIIIIMVSATSFIGAPVISIGIIYRILCIISFIFKYYQSLLSFHNIFIIVLPQMIIEILITYVMSFMSTYLSIQSFKLTFIQKDNFSLKYLFNYILNYLIIICFLIFISALLKIYLI